MNLADMLSYADIHQLSSIAEHYDCKCNGNSKNELIQSILVALGRRGLFEEYVKELRIEDLRFLNSLLFDARDSYSLEELLARVKQASFDAVKDEQKPLSQMAAPRETIAHFKQRGWLFNGFSQQTKYLFQVPQDLKSRLCKALKIRFSDKLVTIDEPEAYRDEHKIILDDISHVLHYIYHQDIQLAADGTMYRRHIQQLLDRLTVREEPVSKGGWRFGYGRHFRDYPTRLSFIYDYCYFNDLIMEQSDRLLLTEKGKESVLLQKREDPLQVYQFWLRLYKGPIPNLPAVVHWVELLSTSWVTVDSLHAVLLPFIKPYFYDKPESILDLRIIQMMVHLGLIRLGEHPEYGKCIVITPYGSRLIQGTYLEENDKIEIPIDNNTMGW